MEQLIREIFNDQGRVAVSVELPVSESSTEAPQFSDAAATQSHPAGSGGTPVPTGGGGNPPPSQSQGDLRRLAAVPQGARALSNPPVRAPHVAHPSGFQRAVGAFRAALPLVQRILPLLDGNFATTVSNIMAPPQPARPPAPPVNLAPIEKGLAELQTGQRELRDQFIEQNSSLKRVEDQLEMVREATDRNTLEQQELLEDLKAVGSKVNLVALIAVGLLAISILVNVILYMHIQRVLP